MFKISINLHKYSSMQTPFSITQQYIFLDNQNLVGGESHFVLLKETQSLKVY